MFYVFILFHMNLFSKKNSKKSISISISTHFPLAESINPMTTMTKIHGTTTAGTRIRLYLLTGPAMDLFTAIVSFTTHILHLESAAAFKNS